MKKISIIIICILAIINTGNTLAFVNKPQSNYDLSVVDQEKIIKDFILAIKLKADLDIGIDYGIEKIDSHLIFVMPNIFLMGINTVAYKGAAIGAQRGFILLFYDNQMGFIILDILSIDTVLKRMLDVVDPIILFYDK